MSPYTTPTAPRARTARARPVGGARCGVDTSAGQRVDELPDSVRVEPPLVETAANHQGRRRVHPHAEAFVGAGLDAAGVLPRLHTIVIPVQRDAALLGVAPKQGWRVLSGRPFRLTLVDAVVLVPELPLLVR